MVIQVQNTIVNSSDVEQVFTVISVHPKEFLDALRGTCDFVLTVL